LACWTLSAGPRLDIRPDLGRVFAADAVVVVAVEVVWVIWRDWEVHCRIDIVAIEDVLLPVGNADAEA
jgi:hypothetical protein